VALVGSFEFLMLLIGSAHQPRLERICEGVADLPVPRQSVPPAGAFLEQTVRAWHTAGHSQQAIARELSIDRHKAPRAHEAERSPARRRKWPDQASARWLVRPMRRGRLRWWT